MDLEEKTSPHSTFYYLKPPVSLSSLGSIKTSIRQKSYKEVIASVSAPRSRSPFDEDFLAVLEQFCSDATPLSLNFTCE